MIIHTFKKLFLDSMGKFFKKIGAVLALVMLTCLMVLVWYRHVGAPQIKGTLKLTGPMAAIDIVRDAEGIPHIYAHSVNDAIFGLGFVHAQDRLWQLEMNRRIAAGRMAEILGPNALDIDRFLRTLGIRKNAEAIAANLSPDARSALDAYARGINAYLKQRSGPLPPEFLLTGAPAPEAWMPADSIGWQTMMAWDLSGNWTQELLRMRLSQRLSLQQINEFLPPYPGDPVVKTRDYTQLYRGLPGTITQLAAVAKIAPPSHIDGMGSNNWVVSGGLSETGKPLLANDPHLGLSAPSVWYFAHLSAPGLNVIGATLPGIPSVVLGRNDRIAWGFTNTGPDVQDLYLERINSADTRQYQAPDGWANFITRNEIIKVKGQPDAHLAVRTSRHGPIISGALALLDKVPLDAKKYVVAFSWTALRPDDLTLQAGLKFGQARNWQEFIEGAKDFSSPQQNIVYADIDGNIGYVAPGRVPIRKPENDLQGLAPAPGWDARYDWVGFIPFDQLPQLYNPASQRIITANQKIISNAYPYFLTSEWSLPYRADRITQLLDAKPKHGMNSFGEMQKDVLSLAAQELLPLLGKVHGRSERAKAALAALAKWDGTMDATRPEPLIFTAWIREASRHIFAGAVGDAIMQDYWEQRNVHRSMVNILKNTEGQGRWCGIAKAIAQRQPCEVLLLDSLEVALTDLETSYGKEMSQWRWGQAHRARSEHRPFGKVALLAKLFDIYVPTGGDAFTINAGRPSFRDEADPFGNRHAAGFRALYDLSDMENSRFIHSTGQSGNRLSPLYSNFTQRWSEVTYLPMQTKRENVEKNALGTLRLIP